MKKRKQQQAPLSYESWYANVYPYLTKHGIWLKGGEMNALPAADYAQRSFRILFTRLSTYFDVASSFTHSLLYAIAAQEKNVFPDLAYLPPERDAVLFQEGRVPWLLGTQTKYGPDGFQVIGFSNSIVQELINVPAFLRHSGIPLGKQERMNREDIPLIILGGANALYSSVLWGADPMIDLVFVGEDTGHIQELMRELRDGYLSGMRKQEILDRLESIPGCVQPEGTATTKKGKRSARKGSISYALVLYNEDSIGVGQLPISEGCRHICSFCAESWNRKPYHDLPVSAVMQYAHLLKRTMGLSHISLFSFNANMYGHIRELLWELTALYTECSIKSQRFDMIAYDPEILAIQCALGKASFSCGLEGISMRMRAYLNKNLDEDALKKSLTLVLSHAVRELKIFLLVTGHEEEEDFAEFEVLLSFLDTVRARYGNRTRIIFSITPLVRFPWTPFEFEAACSPEHYRSILNSMHYRITHYPFEVREAMDQYEYMISQLCVRAAHQHVYTAFRKWLEETSFVYYRFIPETVYARFMQCIEETGISIKGIFKKSIVQDSSLKPWARIDMGIDRKKLFKQYEKNRTGEEIPVKILPPAEEKRLTAAHYARILKEKKAGSIAVQFTVCLSDRVRGLPRAYSGAALARACMMAYDTLTPLYYEYKESRWSCDKNELCWVYGMDVLTLLWHKDAAAFWQDQGRKKDVLMRINQYFSPWGELKGVAQEETRFSLRGFSPFPLAYQDFLLRRGLKYTLLKKEGWEECQFSKEAQKKKVVVSLRTTYDAKAGCTRFIIVPDLKWNNDDFLREAFRISPEQNMEWIRTHMEAYSE